MAEGVKIAVVGATGAVGQEMLKVLEQRKFPASEVICLASERSAGKKAVYQGQEITIEAISPEAFARADMALFAIDSDISREVAPMAQANHCIVIDNSNAFRMDPDVPLIVPEVNPQAAKDHHGLIANPNCSTIIMVVALNPIHQAAGIEHITVSTYQAVSGAGKPGLEELEQHVQNYAQGVPSTPKVFKHPIAFNLIPHIDVFVEGDYTKEEMKMVNETRKIFGAPDMRIAATTVRVPVFRSHSESINIETTKPITPQEAREVLRKAPGVIVQDDPQEALYPMPLMTSDTDEVYVGRIRQDISVPQGLAMWVVGDQIRKGAATNCIQIAELLLKNKWY